VNGSNASVTIDRLIGKPGMDPTKNSSLLRGMSLYHSALIALVAPLQT
jgi:hypothetical protein